MWILLYGYKIDNQMDSFGNQRAVVNVARARGHVGGQKANMEQSDWLADTDEEINEQELEAHYSYMAKGQEVPNEDSGTDFEPLEQTELEEYMAFNDRTVDYDKLKRNLNETRGLLAQKDIDIKEGLKVKAYEISVVKEKHDELVKQSLLTKSHYEGLVKEKTKDVVSLKYLIDVNAITKKHKDNVDSIFYVQGMKKPEVLKDFLTMIQQNLQALVISVRTDRGTEFLNKTLHAFFKEEGIEHQKLILLEPPEQTALSKMPHTTVPSQQELDLLFGPLYDEFFNAGTSRVNKSSSPTDNSAQQDTLPSTNIHPTTEPSTPTHVNAEENNNDQAEFTNPFCTPVQEVIESSSRNIGNSNMHTFNQPQDSEYRWTKDHPKSFISLTDYKSGNSLTNLLARTSSKLKVVMEKQKDDDQHCNSQTKQRPCSKGLCSGRGVLISRSFTPVLAWKRLFVYVHKPDGLLIPDHPEKFYRLGSLYYGFETSSKSHDPQSPPGSLMSLTSSRPDIVQVVCYCARYQAIPTEKHLKEVKRIFRYLRGTINIGLWYPKDSGFELTTFSNVDHVRCIDTRKSTSGGIQFLGDKLVSWMSKKQDCTAMSSAEAEYVALSASCAQVMWMRTQLKDYGFNYNKIPLYCDSQSAIAISCNPVQHSRTKHIHTRYHFIKEQVENGIIELYFVRTEYQLADMFTKALPEDRFQYLVKRIGMRCLTPAELEVLTNESA
ncbi:hypothetical protein Tco_0303165 [Tanacetum coccineum]